MWRIRTHRMGIDRGSQLLFSDFANDGAMWAGEGHRDIRVLIPFSERFVTPPVVMVGMSMLDVANDANTRVDISSDNVTETDFEIVFHTWGDTKVARARADWMAFGEVADDDDWDVP
ncbi:MAG: H-type lectin domain-containing protein [Maritimibacter harenae]|jgi:hypothetical protein